MVSCLPVCLAIGPPVTQPRSGQRPKLPSGSNRCRHRVTCCRTGCHRRRGIPALACQQRRRLRVRWQYLLVWWQYLLALAVVVRWQYLLVLRWQYLRWRGHPSFACHQRRRLQIASRGHPGSVGLASNRRPILSPGPSGHRIHRASNAGPRIPHSSRSSLRWSRNNRPPAATTAARRSSSGGSSDVLPHSSSRHHQQRRGSCNGGGLQGRRRNGPSPSETARASSAGHHGGRGGRLQGRHAAAPA